MVGLPCDIYLTPRPTDFAVGDSFFVPQGVPRCYADPLEMSRLGQSLPRRRWMDHYGDMQFHDVKSLERIEPEKRRPMTIVADLTIDDDIT